MQRLKPGFLLKRIHKNKLPDRLEANFKLHGQAQCLSLSIIIESEKLNCMKFFEHWQQLCLNSKAREDWPEPAQLQGIGQSHAGGQAQVLQMFKLTALMKAYPTQALLFKF